MVQRVSELVRNGYVDHSEELPLCLDFVVQHLVRHVDQLNQSPLRVLSRILLDDFCFDPDVSEFMRLFALRHKNFKHFVFQELRPVVKNFLEAAESMVLVSLVVGDSRQPRAFLCNLLDLAPPKDFEHFVVQRINFAKLI